MKKYGFILRIPVEMLSEQEYYHRISNRWKIIEWFRAWRFHPNENYYQIKMNTHIYVYTKQN